MTGWKVIAKLITEVKARQLPMVKTGNPLDYYRFVVLEFLDQKGDIMDIYTYLCYSLVVGRLEHN